MQVLNATDVINKIYKNETAKSNTILTENLKYLVDNADYIKNIRIASGVPPLKLSFVNGIKQFEIVGKTQQNGTPTPTQPVDVKGVGDYDSETGKYKIPIVCGNFTTPIYLNSPLMVDETLYSTGKREVEWRKLVLTGDEEWKLWAMPSGSKCERFYFVMDDVISYGNYKGYSSHFIFKDTNEDIEHLRFTLTSSTKERKECGITIDKNKAHDISSFKSYLKSEYDAGHPVTIYYPLAEPTSEQVDIPVIKTVRGINIFKVNTSVQPSNVTVIY